MSVKLTIEITGPLDAEDRDLLSGVAVMTLAIANHEMAKNAFPDTFGDQEQKQEPAPCAAVSEDGTLICVGKVGHRGRHKFRPVPTEDIGTVAQLPN